MRFLIFIIAIIVGLIIKPEIYTAAVTQVALFWAGIALLILDSYSLNKK